MAVRVIDLSALAIFSHYFSECVRFLVTLAR